MSQSQPFIRRHAQSGLTLIELMVAMVVGLAVIGAGLAMYTTSGMANRNSSALSQISEDASLALGLMRNHIAMAGYSRMVVDPTTSLIGTAYKGLPLFGCRYGVDSSAGSSYLISATGAQNPLTCATSPTTASDALIVLYEAEPNNTWSASGTSPTDCLNQKAPLVPASTAAPITSAYYIAENRFFINGSSLSCLGNGNATPQPLVDNVTQMRVWYGVAAPQNADGTRNTVAQQYLRADQVGDLTTGKWNQVVSVRLCLVVSSKDNVLDAVTPYVDCDGNSSTPADRHLYRAFTTTVVLNNRIYQN